MKLQITLKRFALAATALVAVAFAARAADKPAPLKLQSDTKAINRDANQRVSYSAVVKKTAPSVVYVFSSKKVRGQDFSQFFGDPSFRRFFGQPGERSGRQPEQRQQSLGSGVIISSDGYIVTNNHVVDGADDVKVSLGEPRREFKAAVVGRDPKADVAVLKIEATGLPAATLGDSDKLEVGDVVLAIGNPFGVGQSVSQGIVSALGRAGLGIEDYEDFIQTDAAINPGNSGGALFDTDGRVIGINTAIASRTGAFNGVGFAIPINLARSLAEQLVSKGRIDRAYLGVKTQPMEAELSSAFQVTHGALIAEVQTDTPADKAGLKGGDIITKVNNTEIRDDQHLRNFISRMEPGTTVSVEYNRDGKTKSLSVKLAQLPDEKLAAKGGGSHGKDDGVLNGVGVGDLTAELRGELNLPRRIQGVVITEVDPDSASARAGLRENDVIMELDRQPVHTAAEAVKLSEDIKGPKVTVRLWRNGSARYIVVDESK